MDPAILSASAALIGSLVGGISTIGASWITQHRSLRAQAHMHERTRRETLYAEFIVEASRCFTEAWGHEAQSPEVVAGLYGTIHRMRLVSSEEIVALAQGIVREIVEAYAAPVRTFQEARERIMNDEMPDLLEVFSAACRQELDGLTVRPALPRR